MLHLLLSLVSSVALVVQLFERVTAAFAAQENFTNFTLTGEDVTLTAERVSSYM